jgi:DNA repair protein RadC
MANYRVPAYKCVLVRERSTLLDAQINGTPAAIALAVKELADAPNEQFIAFVLDTKLKVIGQHTVTTGTLDASLVHPREVFRAAIILNGSSIIVAHNHPSGDLEPSSADRAVVRRLQQAGEVLGIQLLDSIIVNDQTGISMRETGDF